MTPRALAAAVALLVLSGGAAGVGSPPDGAISPGHRTVQWKGVLTSGGSDTRELRVDVPASYWRQHPGGVTVRIEWTAPDTELDLFVSDGESRQLAASEYGGRTFQQVYLFRPARGAYTISVEAVVAAEASYTGTVSLVADPVRAARLHRGGMRFQQGLVDPQILAKEPGVVLGHGQRSYVVAPWGLSSLSSMVWMSEDRGRTHRLRSTTAASGTPPVSTRPCAAAVGGGDSDVAVDRTGRLYFAALTGVEVTTGFSVDDGRTWTCSPIGSTIPEIDRPWLAPSPAADGDGPALDAYLVYHDLVLGQLPVGQEVKPAQIHVDATRDGGRTWEARGAYGRGLVPFGGPVFVAADGTLYQSFQAGDAPWLARSADEGRTFTLHRVAQRHGDASNTWVSGAVDARGDVYVAWVDSGSYAAMYSSSKDGGRRWSPPTRVSPPDSIAMLPWISAGAAGDVAVSWYGASASGLPDHVPPGTPWHPYVARSARADAASPSFELASLSPVPVHLGPVCTPCLGDHGLLGDMLETAISPDGQLLAAYVDNARPDPEFAPPYPYLVLARQVAGQGLSAAEAARAAVLEERTGDSDAPGAQDLAGLPTAAVAAGGLLRIQVPLASAADLSSGGSSTATDSYWLVLWKAGGKVGYAAMHVGASGEPQFLAGDEPVGVGSAGGVDSPLRRQLYASYPPAFPVRGSVDTARRQLTLEVPLSHYRLKAGDTLHMLQAFTLAGVTSERKEQTMLRGVDSTPARSVRLR